MTSVQFRVIDSLGNELAVSGGGVGGGPYGEKRVYGTALFDPVDERAKELTITPYLQIPKQGELKTSDSKGNLIDIDVSQYEGLDLKFDSFTVKLP